MDKTLEEYTTQNVPQVQKTEQDTQEYTIDQNVTSIEEATKITNESTAPLATMQSALEHITNFIYTDHEKTIKEITALPNLVAEIQEFASFFFIELEKANQDFADISVKQFRELVRQRWADFKAAKDTIDTEKVKQAAKEYPRITTQPTNSLNYPVDKLNGTMWNLLEAANPNGQLQLDIVTSKKGNQKDAIVYYGIDFNELNPDLKITKVLTPFDKRVYIAVAALFNGGNNVISATQIYKMMGNSKQPKAEQIQKINDSVTKMGAAHVYLDNEQEMQINKKYTHFKYDASLLPFERISAYVNGKLSESTIHLFREPPLITFARERKQIIRLTRQLLDSPIKKTDANLRLEDYLIERIGHMKNPKSNAPCKMLFSTIYERCGITTTKQKQRTPEKIQRYLDHYKKSGWITGYTTDKDSITIQI